MSKSSTFIIIFFIIFSQLLGQKIKEIVLLDKSFYSLVSNVGHQTMILEQSNIWLSNLTISNTHFIEQIKKFPNYFGNDINKKLKFYELATKHYFDHLADKKSKIKAIEIWNELIDIDIKNLKATKTKNKDWTNFNSPFNSRVLEKAFEMQRYLHLIAGSPHSDLNELDHSLMEKTCRRYESYYRGGLNYSRELGLNFLAYFLHQEDYKNAKMAYDRLGIWPDDYYKQQLHHLKSLKATNETENHIAFKHYLLLMQTDKNLNQKQQDKYFNNANAILFVGDNPVIKSSYKFNKLKDIDKKNLYRAMKIYIKALTQNPNMPEANYNLGLIFASEYSVPKAILYLKRALKHHSDFNTLYSLALLEMKLKNYQAAYQYLKEAEIYNQNLSSLYNNLSVCSKYYKDSQIINPRFFYINKAIALNKDDYRFYLTKAGHLKDNGDHEGYLRQIQTALKKVKEIEEKAAIEIFSIKTVANLPEAKKKAIEKINNMIEAEKEKKNSKL